MATLEITTTQEMATENLFARRVNRLLVDVHKVRVDAHFDTLPPAVITSDTAEQMAISLVGYAAREEVDELLLKVERILLDLVQLYERISE